MGVDTVVKNRFFAGQRVDRPACSNGFAENSNLLLLCSKIRLVRLPFTLTCIRRRSLPVSRSHHQGKRDEFVGARRRLFCPIIYRVNRLAFRGFWLGSNSFYIILSPSPLNYHTTRTYYLRTRRNGRTDSYNRCRSE